MDAMETVHHTYTMNETPRRRITVTSSLNEIYADQPGKRVGVSSSRLQERYLETT